ncbi:MAG TPA: GAF domain-containing sensor histidine kinase [Actinomycetota bacterium]|nr:GAF domain-containing sensor histidine kinase [Actinomycetota bacterium]
MDLILVGEWAAVTAAGMAVGALIAARVGARRAARSVVQRLRAASAITARGLAARDRQSALEAMTEALAHFFDADSCVIARAGDDGVLRPEAWYGSPEMGRGDSCRGIATTALDTGLAAFGRDARDRRAARACSGVALPLASAGRTLGVLQLESRRRRYRVDDLSVLEPLADQVAAVVVNLELRTGAEQKAAAELAARTRLETLKDDFVSTISHELRTPLTSLRGYAQTVLERSAELSAAERAMMLERMVHQCNKVAAMIDRLGLVSRLEVGDAQQAHAFVDLDDLVHDAAEAADAVGRVRVEVEPGAGAVTDRARLHHIVRNLVENACKYSPAGAPVLVTASASADGLTVEVVDQGPGIPAGFEETVFDRFQRLSDPKLPSVPGTGLGLYIARRLARDLGGDLTVEPCALDGGGPWTGARFVLRLPPTGAAPLTAPARA